MPSDAAKKVWQEAHKAGWTSFAEAAAVIDRAIAEAVEQERARIVAWLREDAGLTRIDLHRMHKQKLLTPSQTDTWEATITTKLGIATAIERGDHKERADG